MSRDPKRIRRITAKLANLWEAHPDLRFGQLVENLFTMYVPTDDAWSIEDDRWEHAIDHWMENP